MQGKTLRRAAWGAADVAGTAIVYMMPTTNGTASQVLVDTGSATCGTYASGAPTTCHQLAWTSASGTGGGVNAQTTSYTLVAADAGKLVTMNGSSLTATIYATHSSTYAVGIKNLNASALTISRNGLQINGGTSNITIQQYQAVACFSDGTNYFCDVPEVAGGSITLTPASNGLTLALSATPSLGAATGTSVLLSGNIDGTAPVTITTGSSATLGGTFKSGYTLNQNATAATAITYTLPTAAAGRQYGVGNSYNGSAATTGTLELLTSASGQFIIFTDGTLSATGGFVQSGGGCG